MDECACVSDWYVASHLLKWNAKCFHSTSHATLFFQLDRQSLCFFLDVLFASVFFAPRRKNDFAIVYRFHHIVELVNLQQSFVAMKSEMTSEMTTYTCT